MSHDNLLVANKIKTLDSLAGQVERLKNDNKKVVHCHGVFDLVHIGHIRHFEEARKLGDVLVVTLTPDRHVNKGTHRPAFPEALRAEMLASLEVVDFVAINLWPTAVETIRQLRPDIYCKGGEYKQNQVDAESNMLPEIAVAKEVGTLIEYTDDIVFSSSELLNRHFSSFPPETDAWLERFKEQYTADDIISYLDQTRSLKVLVVGEAIIDEYVFCDSIGKSTKDPVLACQLEYTEAFAGGSLAIANHLAGFCDQVGLITFLGNRDRQESFIRDTLIDGIEPIFLSKTDSPTICKRRFVDRYSQNKLFELYIMNDRPLEGRDENLLIETLDTSLEEYDLVIVADYGHGMLTQRAISHLCDKAKFLAVNTQSNAGNRGFNAISKFKRADYVCLANHEISIETRMREGILQDLLLEVAQRIDCRQFTVTRGKDGSLHYEADQGFTEVPAFASQVADRVGAGDAVLALTSLLVSQGVAWDVVGFMGNVAGAQMVTELGNRVPISRIPFTKHLISLLK